MLFEKSRLRKSRWCGLLWPTPLQTKTEVTDLTETGNRAWKESETRGSTWPNLLRSSYTQATQFSAGFTVLIERSSGRMGRERGVTPAFLLMFFAFSCSQTPHGQCNRSNRSCLRRRLCVILDSRNFQTRACSQASSPLHYPGWRIYTVILQPLSNTPFIFSLCFRSPLLHQHRSLRVWRGGNRSLLTR